jgi:hypothetical protein
MKLIKRFAANYSVALTNVTALEVSFDSQDNSRRTVKNAAMKALSLILPSLREIDLSYMKASQTTIEAFCKNCPHLNKVTWKGSRASLFLTGQDFRPAMNLTELCLDGSVLYTSHISPDNLTDEAPAVYRNLYMLALCPHLERVSIKDIRFAPFGGKPQPVNDAMIAKYVRRAPALRWLKSDLSAECVAALKQKRPEITFVSE